MFAALYLPSLPGPAAERRAQLMSVAQEFSPRVERIQDDWLALDVSGLGRWFEAPRALGDALRRTAADRGLAAHVAIAPTRTAALLCARGRAGLTVALPGEESARLASLPLNVLTSLRSWTTSNDRHRPRSRNATNQGETVPLATLHRWGLKTLGDLAALPIVELSERLGQAGVVWQRLARGEDVQPLVPVLPDERFEESIELEWPIDQLEPLSFVLGRLFDALCARLERADRGVAILHLRFDLVGGERGPQRFARMLQLPAPMRDSRTLRTLALLDLESNPPPAAIDRVTVAAEVVDGRVLQFSLLARALPAEKVSTLLARLSALMGSDRVGAPALVDSYRPGAFAMTPFEADRSFNAEFAKKAKVAETSNLNNFASSAASASFALKKTGLPPDACRPSTAVLRRFRQPIPARVDVQQGQPVRVTSDRRHLRGGYVEVCAGPWRSSGEWWGSFSAPAAAATSENECGERSGALGPPRAKPLGGVQGPPPSKRGAASAWGWGPTRTENWDRDEWEVTLRDGAMYLIFRDRPRDAWFIDGILD